MLKDVIAGKGVFKRYEIAGHDPLVFKEPAPRIVCKDGTTVSVQASHTCYCEPRTDRGPYTHVEVGYPDADPPDTWAEYADGEYPSDVYGYVPIELVEAYIEAHGGEVDTKTHTLQDAIDEIRRVEDAELAS